MQTPQPIRVSGVSSQCVVFVDLELSALTLVAPVAELLVVDASALRDADMAGHVGGHRHMRHYVLSSPLETILHQDS